MTFARVVVASMFVAPFIQVHALIVRVAYFNLLVKSASGHLCSASVEVATSMSRPVSRPVTASRYAKPTTED